jgi:hypothetical protein
LLQKQGDHADVTIACCCMEGVPQPTQMGVAVVSLCPVIFVDSTIENGVKIENHARPPSPQCVFPSSCLNQCLYYLNLTSCCCMVQGMAELIAVLIICMAL